MGWSMGWSSRWSSVRLVALGVVAALGLAATSQAAPYALRNPKLQIVVALFDLPPLDVPASPTAPAVLNATRNGDTLTSAVFPSKVFDTPALKITVTGASPITGALIDASNPAATFTAMGGVGGTFGGAMPLRGTAKICLLLGGCVAPTNDMTVTLPLSVVGGVATATATFLANLTIHGATWRADTVTIPNGTGATNMVTGGVAPTAMGDNLAVKLVAPLMVTTTLGGPFALVPAWSVLSFEVPEPGVLALGMGAVGALVLMGLRRRYA